VSVADIDPNVYVKKRNLSRVKQGQFWQFVLEIHQGIDIIAKI
jgi:hypothetical protein